MIDYTKHSPITDTGEYRNLMRDLPTNILLIGKVIRNLLLHVSDAAIENYKIPSCRLSEMNQRYISKILTWLNLQQSGSLTQLRSTQQRLICVCRDFAVFLCSILREQGIAARVRYGFATYIYKGFYHEHVVAEYWSHQQQRWIAVDVRIDPQQLSSNKRWTGLSAQQLLDLPLTHFLPAHLAWQQIRNGQLKADQFGFGLMPRFCGAHWVIHALIRDIAALNHYEMLLWDNWGYMQKYNFDELTTTSHLLQRFDELADCITHESTLHLGLLASQYQHDPLLKLKDRIVSYSPANQRRPTIELLGARND